MEERLPEESETANQAQPGTDDGGLQGAVRGLVETVNATFRQFAEAADAFARETTRVMDGLSARLQGAAGETRDMAAMAGRSADEASRLSERAEGIVSSAEQAIRDQVQTLVAELRVELDEALSSSADAVASARLVADEAERRNRETQERVEQAATSTQQAVTAAETAAEAARHSAESVEAAAAEARDRLLEEASRMDHEAAARMEQSLAASREAAGAAERAAEDARSAALEAMTHAAEARTPALESAIGIGAQELLDRLEADYQLLAELVGSLHSRIAGLSGAAYVPPAQEVAATEPELREPVAAAETEAGAEKDAPTASPSWDQSSTAWSRQASAEGTSYQAAPSAEPNWPSNAADTDTPAQRRDDDATPADESQPSQAWDAQAPQMPPAERPSWEAALSGAEAPSGVLATLQGEAPSAAVEGYAPPTADPNPWPQVRLETAPDWQVAGELAQLEAALAAGTEGASEVEIEPSSGIVDNGEPEMDTPVASTEPESPALVLAGHVVLNIAPVPDFDRLLSLDGALGRLGSVRNVTLADYAKEEVTFRVELNDSTTVEDFTNDLSAMSSQTLEVMAASPGHLQLRILRPGN